MQGNNTTSLNAYSCDLQFKSLAWDGLLMYSAKKKKLMSTLNWKTGSTICETDLIYKIILARGHYLFILLMRHAPSKLQFVKTKQL